MASMKDKLASPHKHPFRLPEQESTPAKSDHLRKMQGLETSPPFLLQPKIETFYPNVQADSMPTSAAHRFMKMEAAFNSRSDSESRREEGVKLMNLEKFIEVNNFMPVPPQKPPTANSQQPPVYHHMNKGAFSALGTRTEKLTQYKEARAVGNSKYVNLSMESKSQSSESIHEESKEIAHFSHHPYQNRMAEMALQMYAPQPSIKIKREVSRKNSISSDKSNSNSFEETKQTQLKKIQAPLTTPQIGSVTPTSLFKNGTPATALQMHQQIQSKKQSSTQPTSRSASMNLSRGMEIPGMPHRLFSDQNFSGIGMAPPLQARHQRVLSLDAKLPSSRIDNPKQLKKQILESLGRSHPPKNIARFNPPPHQIQSILAGANPARFLDQDKILHLRNYRKTMDPPEALPLDMQGKPQQVKFKRNFLDQTRGRAFTNHALFDMNILASGMEGLSDHQNRLINLVPTEKVHKVFQQPPPPQYISHKKTQSYQFNGQHDLDISYLQQLRSENSKRYGTAMSEERVLKTGSSPLTRPKIVKNKLPAPFKQNLRQFKDNRDIGTAQTSAATFGHGGGNIFTPPNNHIARNIYKNISVNASVAMTENGENKSKKESIIEVQSCSLTDEDEEESANFDRAVRKLDFSASKNPPEYRQIHSEATPQIHRELDNFSVLLPYPQQPTIMERSVDPISESYFTNIKKWNKIEPLVTTPVGKMPEVGTGMKSTIKPVHGMGPLDNSGNEMVHRTPQLKRDLVSEVKPRKGLFSRPGERQKVSYTPSTAATSESLKLERPFSGRFSLGPKVRFSKKQQTKGQ